MLGADVPISNCVRLLRSCGCTPSLVMAGRSSDLEAFSRIGTSNPVFGRTVSAVAHWSVGRENRENDASGLGGYGWEGVGV
jgi:hypothetical protein